MVASSSPDNAAQNTAVICHMSLSPATSTLFDPLASIVHVELGTIFMPVWSQFKMRSDSTSSISTTVLISKRICYFSFFKMRWLYISWSYCFLFTKFKHWRCDFAQTFVSFIGPPFSLRRFLSTLLTMASSQATVQYWYSLASYKLHLCSFLLGGPSFHAATMVNLFSIYAGLERQRLYCHYHCYSLLNVSILIYILLSTCWRNSF